MPLCPSRFVGGTRITISSSPTLSSSPVKGEWVHNKYEGVGKYTWPNGTSYEGQWIDNVYVPRGLPSICAAQRVPRTRPSP